MTSSPLVALVIGAGPNIGISVARKLKSEGYAVALGSRSTKASNDTGTTKAEIWLAEGYLPITVDAGNEASIREAFDKTQKELGGPPNVVIYNAAVFHAPASSTSVLSLPFDGLKDALAVSANLFLTAQLALAGFESEGHKNHPKAIIVTGGLFPFHPAVAVPARVISMDVQKLLEARLVATLSNDYKDKDIKFFYATLVNASGGFAIAEFPGSGDLHAKVYWELINSQEGAKWDYRFTPEGKKLVANGYE